MKFRRAAAVAALLLVPACASRAPRLALPLRVDADCESRSVKQTAIDSIVASTDDTVRAAAYPGDATMRKQIRDGGGAFAYWPQQPLRLPRTARALGVDGDYVDLVRAVITNDVEPGSGSRPIWLTFRTPAGERIVLERAYDTQNVCIEGTRQV